MKDIEYKRIRIMDSITWLYLNGIIEDVERDRLKEETTKIFTTLND